MDITRLPGTSRELFGREADLAWLDACWNDGVYVATIVAFGGVGKSALVNRWLAARRDKEWDGAERVFGWSFYSQGTDRLSSSDAFIDAALRWFGDADPTKGSAWDKGERLAELVREHKTILVLDGVEPLQWGPGVQHGRLKDPAVETLLKSLATRNHGLCLVTSRSHLTDLEALVGDKVRTKDLGNLSPVAGAELLRARKVIGTDEELQKASEEYKGHGLALTLLGSYLAEVAEGDVRKRREIGPLTAAEEHGGHARRVMTSYEPLLGRPEAAIVRMLGLFDRPANEDEIDALRAEPPIAGLTDALVGISGRNWNRAVAKLRKVGLISTEQDKQLDAHPLVREHFGEQLRREQLDAWREGHQRLYEHLKAKAKELPDTIEEMAPLYAAVVHGCLAGKHEDARHEVHRKRIRRGNEAFSLKMLGAFGSEVAVLSAFFNPPWERLTPGLSDLDQAWVLNAAGFALRALGQLADAARLMRLGLEQRIAQKDWKEAARSASNISELLQTRGELRDAIVRARESVKFADVSGDGVVRMVSRATLAAAQHAMGVREAAATQFEEADLMQKERQPLYSLLYSFPGFQYCDLLLAQGRDADVRERAAQTLKWAKANLGLLDIALDHLSLGRAHLLGAQRGTGGDLEHASSHLHEAVDGLRRAGGQDDIPLGLLARAALHTYRRSFALARRDLVEALSLSNRCEFRLHEADAHLGLARLALAEQDPSAAREHLAKARTIIAATEYHRRDQELAELMAEADEMAEKRTSGDHPYPPPRHDNIHRLDAMTHLLDTLSRLLPAQFETLLSKLAVPTAHLSSSYAPQATRATELLRWVEQQNRGADLERILAEVLGHAAPPRLGVGASALSSPLPGPTTPPASRAATPTPTSAVSEPIDLGIVVALKEEVTELLSLVAPYVSQRDGGMNSFVFTRNGYRGVVSLVGAMGESEATRVTERQVAHFHPAAVITMGISGGVHEDLRVGDVYVPVQAVQYMQDGKVSPDDKGGFAIIPGAPAARADNHLHTFATGFDLNHPEAHARWRRECREDLERLLPEAADRERLCKEGVIRRDVAFRTDGHEASGPVVVGAPAFSAWIRSHNRNVKAIDMESAAVLIAAQSHQDPKRALVIRGISDNGDPRKKELDALGDGALRKYAMRTAARLLLALLDVEALPRNPR